MAKLPTLQDCPRNLDQLTLGDWSRFYIEYGKKLDEQYAALMQQEDSIFRKIDETALQVERMYSFAAFFTKSTLRHAKRQYRIGEVSAAYGQCFTDMAGAEDIQLEYEFTWKRTETIEVDGEELSEVIEEKWYLPPVELLPNSTMTFGEFIDSKVVVQDAQQQQSTRWELLHQVAAIFLRRKDEPYTDQFIFPDSDRLALMNALPMRIALIIGEWFNQFNNFLEQHFPVFHKSEIKGGRNMKLHFDQWGWINFLKSIAQTKVFDVHAWGVDSIECARRAKCFDVLIYASEDKSHHEAEYFDMEDARRGHKQQH